MMAQLVNNILFPFTGTLGGVVGYRRNGKYLIRSRPTIRKDNQSPARLQQYAKFSFIAKFLGPVAPLLNRKYHHVIKKMSPFNKAFSAVIRNALTGEYPVFSVDYSKLILGTGNLPNAAAPAASSPLPGKLVFIWSDNSGMGRALPGDIAFAAVYCEELNQWICNADAATRSSGAYTMDVTAFSGKTVQTYMGFGSVNGRLVSDSLYTGVVNIL